MRVDFTPKPPPPPQWLSADGQLIYEVLRDNQEYGGATARKIRKVLEANCITDSRRETFTLQRIGDILYEELKVNKLVYKIGEKGGKWRIVPHSDNLPVPSHLAGTFQPNGEIQ